jgi:hypothetical protein
LYAKLSDALKHFQVSVTPQEEAEEQFLLDTWHSDEADDASLFEEDEDIQWPRWEEHVKVLPSKPKRANQPPAADAKKRRG